MKAKPAVFFAKHPRLAVTAMMLTFSLAQAQGQSAPGAVQQPYYRQPGSAYVPPGTTARAPQTRPSAPAAAQQGYQPGFGTPPGQSTPSYKPPTIKGSTAARPKVPVLPSGKSKPVSLESKVARLEKKDVHQDRRLNSLERGAGSPTIEGGGSYVPDTGKLYTVRPGDTLWRIADKHSTSINALKSANRLSGETIAVGQTLRIPGHGSAPAEVRESGSHVVRPGDTFSRIAQANGVSQDALARANPSAYPDRLLVGEKLTIPGKSAGPAPRSSGTNSPAPVSSSRYHVVKKGESLGAIAKMHGIPTATVVTANKLKNANMIEPGQRLVIPGGSVTKPAAPAPIFPPADSDTTPLPGAGLMAEAPAPAPAPAPLASNLTAAPAPAYEPLPKAAPPTSSNRRGIVAYRLERGDDINTVAALFNTTPEKIREMNKLPADRKLKEGEEVVVPSLGAVSLN